MDTPRLPSGEWTARHADFEKWVRTVRNPADAATEGVRRIVVDHAQSEYEVAPLPDGQWALRFGLEYKTGDCHSHYSPWSAYPSREECVATFLQAARAHFGTRLIGIAEGVAAQGAAQKGMLEQLRNDGLFGFIEPDVVCNEPL